MSVLSATWITVSPVASSNPSNPQCEKVNGGTVCEEDPPGMHYDAVYLQPCDNLHFYIFGRDAQSGDNLVCHWNPNTGTGIWDRGITLFGVKRLGGACPSWISGVAAAQSLNGRALVCEWGNGWILNS